ncbi:hypothetical protein FACS1894184_05230 [Clostridia bacterium]|nr:hypothetical protein FACS1894184_05230 [Clostridia bacterium]
MNKNNSRNHQIIERGFIPNSLEVRDVHQSETTEESLRRFAEMRSVRTERVASAGAFCVLTDTRSTAVIDADRRRIGL